MGMLVIKKRRVLILDPPYIRFSLARGGKSAIDAGNFVWVVETLGHLNGLDTLDCITSPAFSFLRFKITFQSSQAVISIVLVVYPSKAQIAWPERRNYISAFLSDGFQFTWRVPHCFLVSRR